MKKAHGAYMASEFPILSKGMDEDTEEFKRAFPMKYPMKFQRYFFRWVKAISNKKGTEVDPTKQRKRFKHLPQAFIISAGTQRCTMHPTRCPEEDCPYMSNNHRVVLTKQLMKKRLRAVPAHR